MPTETAGTLPDGTPIHRIRLEGHGLRASILTIGAALEALEAPDRHGTLANVTLGPPRAGDYATRGQPYFGSVCGRFANRIARARFTLDGREHALAANEGDTCLHGGPDGFSWRNWTLLRATGTEAVLALDSPDGDQGFPGALRVTVRYALEAPATLRIAYAASTDAPGVVNLTQHGYWNLRGAGTALDHELSIAAEAYLPVDDRLIPTGEERPVDGTPFDFRAPAPIGARLGGRYDHCWALRGGATPDPRPVATLHDPGSGRAMEVWTDRPGMQLYGGQGLDGRWGHGPGAGVALETQGFPDAPNQPRFPSTVLRPGEGFRAVTLLRFTARR